MKRVRYTGNLPKLKKWGIDRDLRLEIGTLIDVTGDDWGVVEFEFDHPILNKVKEEYDIPMHSLQVLT